MPWDEAAFRTRIRAGADRLGINERQVMRRAGVAEDTFSKDPSEQGRTYNLIEKIAGAVELTVGQAIGEPEMAADLLELAIAAAQKAVPSDRPEMLSPAIISAYEVLSARRKENLPIDESALSTLEQTLRAQSRLR